MIHGQKCNTRLTTRAYYHRERRMVEHERALRLLNFNMKYRRLVIYRKLQKNFKILKLNDVQNTILAKTSSYQLPINILTSNNECIDVFVTIFSWWNNFLSNLLRNNCKTFMQVYIFTNKRRSFRRWKIKNLTMNSTFLNISQNLRRELTRPLWFSAILKFVPLVHFCSAYVRTFYVQNCWHCTYGITVGAVRFGNVSVKAWRIRAIEEGCER